MSFLSSIYKYRYNLFFNHYQILHYILTDRMCAHTHVRSFFIYYQNLGILYGFGRKKFGDFIHNRKNKFGDFVHFSQKKFGDN